MRMLKTVFGNILHGYATRLYPEKTRTPFERARADLRVDMDQCKLCGTCARTCPTEAISVDRERRQWERDLFSCITCGDCVEACPVQALSFLREPPAPCTGRIHTAYTQPPKENRDEKQPKGREDV